MLAAVRKLCRPDNVTNWFVLAREYAVLAVVVASCLASYERLVEQGQSLWWMAPIYLRLRAGDRRLDAEPAGCVDSRVEPLHAVSESSW